MASHDSFGPQEGSDENPPPYQAMATSTEFVAGSTNVRDNNRIDINMNSELGSVLSELTPGLSEDPSPTAPPRHAARKAWKIKLNVVIQVVGSRGDVQPFVALGNELQKHGHRVRLATHSVFEKLIRDAGLEFYSIGGDPAELMAYMVKNPGLIPNMKSLRVEDIRRKRAMVAEMLDGCWRSCVQPDNVTKIPFVADAIIANPPSFAHVHCAQALGVPVHLMFTMPWSSTRAFPHPLANLNYSSVDRKAVNHMSYGIVEFMTWQGLGDVINKWRQHTLDLEPVPATEGPSLTETLKVPFTYCWSPTLVPKPADWRSHIDVCGFFLRDPPPYTPPPELDAFLRAGPPPVYIGFGSIVIDDSQKTTAKLLEAVRETGVRAIISRGWSNLGGDQDSNVFYLGDCPHEWLFQHVVAVVHHGGAGTTACGLLNGKPTTIVPFFGDQPFWGNMVAAAGAGPNPIRYGSLNSQNLAEAIRFCLTPEATTAARAISEKIRTEAGLRAAVDLFHANLPLKNLQCDLLPDQPAAWVYKDGKKRVKMSKVAARILTDSAKVDRKGLKFHETNPIIIDNRRWDPVTALSSASAATATDMADATVGIFVKPYAEYKRGRTKYSRLSSLHTGNPTSTISPTESITHSNNSSSLRGSDRVKGPSRSTESTKGYEKKGMNTAGAMAVASVNSVGKFFVSSSKGLLVDIPLAAAEGMRAVPRLYGGEVKDYGKVRDWKSGVSVAGKTFSHGVYEGVSDIFVQTYRGKKKEDAVGVAKGLCKGLVSLTMKTGAATVGLLAYPSQGVARSIRVAVKSTTRRSIVEARLQEGEWLMTTEVGMQVDRAAVIAKFDALRNGIER